MRNEQKHKDRLQYETIDLRLIEPLNRLRPTPPRDPKAAEASRFRFLEQLEEELPSTGGHFGQGLWRWNLDIFQIRAITRPVFTSLWAILVALALLFGGAGITARASQSALPGDRLYIIKTGLEQARLSLSLNLSQQIGLHLSFASNRLDEMQRLVQAGRCQDAIIVSDEFKTYLSKAYAAVDLLESLDPAQAARLSSELSLRTDGFTARLSQIIAKMPETYQTQIRAGIPFPIAVGAGTAEINIPGWQDQGAAALDQNLSGRQGAPGDPEGASVTAVKAADGSMLNQDWGPDLTQEKDNRHNR